MSKNAQRIKYQYNNYRFIRNRELGMRNRVGYEDDMCKKIYTNMDAYQADIPQMNNTTGQGGIFNLEFSLDGNLLVAACEEDSIMIYDAYNQKFINKIENAHDKCVNCVKFLCPHTFATCSDDGTIKLWDTRYLKNCTRTLTGHSNWVKNIEYSERENVMVTSAFDGSIYAWDLSSPSDNGAVFDKVFIMSGLMRTKLTPDGTKMVIATTSGYLIVIHDLNLLTMYNDMKTFRPNLYRLMQLSEQTFPAATMYNYLFNQTRKRNRIEFIDDFPNNAEVISSVQIHPMGWSALSRNVSSDDSDEWTCIHDIQTRDPKDYEDAFSFVDDALPPQDAVVEEDEEDTEDTRPTDIWMGFMTNSHYLSERNPFSNPSNDNERSYMGVMNSGLIVRNPYNRFFFKRPGDRYKIIKNIHRLTHYVEELSVGKGYIKELCFSTDGRLVCSPYDKGVRLLGFNNELQEIPYCVPDKPKELYTLATMNDYHPDVVVCCKFNPKHYQMVSGCLGGEIVWYKPIL